MIRGWNSAPAATPNSLIGASINIHRSGDGATVIGRVILARSESSWGHEIHLQQLCPSSSEEQEQSVVQVHIQAKTCPDISPWVTIRGARKLLCKGVTLQVTGYLQDDINDDSGTKSIIASRVQIIGALPATPYLARLLSIDHETLGKLFSTKESNDTLLALACALQPCALKRCETLSKFCQEEKKAGRFDLLFKNKKLLLLCEELRKFQGWSRGPQAIPKTQPETWSALLRMEQRWCHEIIDDQEARNPAVSVGIQPDSDHDNHVVYGGIDVDPSLNLPDPNDERRIRYVDERKRPQILWMLGLIRRMVGYEDEVDNEVKGDLSEGAPAPKKRKQQKEARELYFVDIGGGRGDLANAVAAFFAQDHVRVKAHVTVLDVNQSSLDAGRQRALKSKLDDKMSFVLCDVANRANVEELCAKQRCDLVFGLHCCGGLAEAAVELAVQANASFCISTCCFRSNWHLASLSKHADKMFDSETTTKDVATQHQSDRTLLAALAVVVSGQGQHRAIHTLNSMRLTAAEDLFKATDARKQFFLKTWQESFPIEYSVQNRIMVGEIKNIS